MTTLDRHRLPVHVVEPVRVMIHAIADAPPRAQGAVLRRVCTPAFTDRVLRLAGLQVAQVFDPLLHNTVSPVIVRGGVRHNVIPSEVELVLDGRVLPGFGADDLAREVQGLLGNDADVRVDSFDPCPDHLDLGLFETLAAALWLQDPDAVPVPYVTMATTDGRHFARLGIQSCGFMPMELPAGCDFATMAHGADERIRVGAVDWKTDAVHRVLETYGSAPDPRATSSRSSPSRLTCD